MHAVAKPQSDYLVLKQRVKEAGLLEKQYGYYSFAMVRTAVLLAACIVGLVLFHGTPVVIIDAVAFGLVFAQIGFLGHEAAHRQIFGSTRNNDIAGLICFNLLLGGSMAAWKDKHDAHHSNPNQIDHDPDIDIFLIAFSPEQLEEKRGFVKFMVKYQAFFLIPLLCFEMYYLRYYTYRYLATDRPKRSGIEWTLIGVHYLWYFALLFSLLTWQQVILFVFVHFAVFGVYMGAVFAPNHKGMPMFDSNEQVDFVLRQVITARNVRQNPITDFMTGGLASQIEHHLFPTMPRNRLRTASKVVRDFCCERDIPYYETGVWRSYFEIFQHLHEVSAPLRATGAA